MSDAIVSYCEMCNREGTSLQSGMNFHLRQGYCMVLMSRRDNAPYQDRLEQDGAVLIYERHDVPRTAKTPEPKQLDQPLRTLARALTQNGRFHEAAQSAKAKESKPEKVRVYKKLYKGIWAYNGTFDLVDSWQKQTSARTVFKFKLEAIEEESTVVLNGQKLDSRRRVVPSSVKLEVWKRDKGRCVKCGVEDELHFDHILPFSKGGTSNTAENI